MNCLNGFCRSISAADDNESSGSAIRQPFLDGNGPGQLVVYQGPPRPMEQPMAPFAQFSGQPPSCQFWPPPMMPLAPPMLPPIMPGGPAFGPDPGILFGPPANGMAEKRSKKSKKKHRDRGVQTFPFAWHPDKCSILSCTLLQNSFCHLLRSSISSSL